MTESSRQRIALVRGANYNQALAARAVGCAKGERDHAAVRCTDDRVQRSDACVVERIRQRLGLITRSNRRRATERCDVVNAEHQKARRIDRSPRTYRLLPPTGVRIEGCR